MEIWKDIHNFPGYQVSNKGRVRSFLNKKHSKNNEPKIMKASDDGNGDYEKTGHYYFEYAGREDKLLYGTENY